MMNYDEFKAYVVDNIKSFLPSEYENASVTLNIVTKNSDVELSGINIRKEDSSISPNIYLESFYDRYKKGDDIEDILTEISEIRVRHENSIDFDTSVISDFEKAKDLIRCRVVNAENSKQYLSDKPHIVKEDLAIMYTVDLGSDHQGGRMSAPINNSLLETYGITLKELHKVAMDNTKTDYSFKSMKEVMIDIMGESAEVMMTDMDLSMYVLTNEDKTFGSVQIFNRKAMDEVATKLGGDFVVLPSSIHEVICLPINKEQPFDIKDLEEMIRDVNATQVALTDQLSNYPYQYDSKDHVLHRMDKMQDRKIDKEEKSPSILDKIAKNQEEIAKKEDNKAPVTQRNKKEPVIV